MKASELRPGRLRVLDGDSDGDVYLYRMPRYEVISLMHKLLRYLEKNDPFDYELKIVCKETTYTETAPLQLREGAFYQTRNGEVTKERLRRLAGDGPLRWHQDSWAYSDDGRLYPDGDESDYDLIAEVPAPPREIQAGDWVVVIEGTGNTIKDGELCQVESYHHELRNVSLVGKGDYWNVSRFRHATAAEIEAHTRGEG